MEIPKKTLKMWADLKEPGDISELAKLIGKSEPTVYKILSTGKAAISQAEKIAKFFKDRKRRAAKITEDNN